MLFGLWLRQIWMPHFCLSDIVHQVLRVYCLTWAYEITLIYLYPPWLYWMAKLLQPCLNLGEYISSGDCRSFYHVDIVYMMLNLFFSSAGRRAVSLLMRVSVCWSCQGHYPSFSVLTILWFFPEHRCFFFFLRFCRYTPLLSALNMANTVLIWPWTRKKGGLTGLSCLCGLVAFPNFPYAFFSLYLNSRLFSSLLVFLFISLLFAGRFSFLTSKRMEGFAGTWRQQ